ACAVGNAVLVPMSGVAGQPDPLSTFAGLLALAGAGASPGGPLPTTPTMPQPPPQRLAISPTLPRVARPLPGSSADAPSGLPTSPDPALTHAHGATDTR